MEHNKQYNRRKKVRFSMLMAILVLSSLFRTALAVTSVVLSSETKDPLICHYFKEIPAREHFTSWRKRVEEIVDKYNLAGYLTDWLKDIAELEKIIEALDEQDRANMDFAALIQQHQAKKESVFGQVFLSCSDTSPHNQSGKLVNIGKLSSGRWVSENAVIAIIDELFRASRRFHDTRAEAAYNLCAKVAQGELRDEHKITQMLTNSLLEKLASVVSYAVNSISSMFTGNPVQPDKDNKND